MDLRSEPDNRVAAALRLAYLPSMAEALILLDGEMLESARAGRHNFVGRLHAACRAGGMSVRYEPDGALARARAVLPNVYAATHMTRPAGPHGVVLRRAIRYPFWAIERSHLRWEWDVAGAAFARVPGPEPERFAGYWRERLLGGPAPAGEAVLIPLQGRLDRQRSFQAMSPVEMVRRVLELTDRPVICTLHPSEDHAEEEMRPLLALALTHSRLRIESGGSEARLRECAWVATMNSSVAFLGFLLGRPAALFARSEHHHVAARVHDLGATRAIWAAEDMLEDPPDFDGYVHWFWQRMCVNAGRPDAEARIAERLRAAGWPV